MNSSTKKCDCGLFISTTQFRRHLRGEVHAARTRKPKRHNILHRDKPRTLPKRKPKKITITHKTIDESVSATRNISGFDVDSRIADVVDEVLTLFKRKNAEYSGGRDTFYNFDSAAPVEKGIMAPFTYCMTLSDKQHNAMWVAMNSTSSKFNIRERLFDQVVYGLIGLAILDRTKE